MTKENANPGDDKPVQPTVESLQQQIENLNKGIATYRDDVRTAKEEARIAKEEALEAKKALEEAVNAKKDDDGEELPPLSDTDRKRLESWAKSQGFVTKEEVVQERQRI